MGRAWLTPLERFDLDPGRDRVTRHCTTRPIWHGGGKLHARRVAIGYPASPLAVPRNGRDCIRNGLRQVNVRSRYGKIVLVGKVTPVPGATFGVKVVIVTDVTEVE